MDRRIAALAEGQHGVFASAQLPRLRSGPAVRSPARATGGCVASTAASTRSATYLSLRGRWMAAVLASAAGPCSVTALPRSLWELIEPARRTGSTSRSLAAARDAGPGLTAHRPRASLHADRTVIDGIPVTCAPPHPAGPGGGHQILPSSGALTSGRSACRCSTSPRSPSCSTLPTAAAGAKRLRDLLAYDPTRRRPGPLGARAPASSIWCATHGLPTAAGQRPRRGLSRRRLLARGTNSSSSSTVTSTTATARRSSATAAKLAQLRRPADTRSCRSPTARSSRSPTGSSARSARCSARATLRHEPLGSSTRVGAESDPPRPARVGQGHPGRAPAGGLRPALLRDRRHPARRGPRRHRDRHARRRSTWTAATWFPTR